MLALNNTLMLLVNTLTRSIVDFLARYREAVVEPAIVLQCWQEGEQIGRKDPLILRESRIAQRVQPLVQEE